jgi:curli biogenesis system outer membrane secretion channel CsgG
MKCQTIVYLLLFFNHSVPLQSTTMLKSNYYENTKATTAPRSQAKAKEQIVGFINSGSNRSIQSQKTAAIFSTAVTQGATSILIKALEDPQVLPH